MNLQDLKDNKAQIIATITEQAGEENVKAVMAEMLKGLDCCDTIEELIENAIYMALKFEVRLEKSHIAKIQTAYHESIGETWNSNKGKFVKI
jgi:hypothetical protein